MLRVFENRVVRRICGHRKGKYGDNGEIRTMGIFVICSCHQMH
jgi:hypothetical protein